MKVKNQWVGCQALKPHPDTRRKNELHYDTEYYCPSCAHKGMNNGTVFIDDDHMWFIDPDRNIEEFKRIDNCRECKLNTRSVE